MIYSLISNFEDVPHNVFRNIFKIIGWEHESINKNNVSALKFLSTLCEHYKDRKVRTGEINANDLRYIDEVVNYISSLNASEIWELYIPLEYKENFVRFDYYRKILAGDVTNMVNDGVDILSALLQGNVYFE